MRLRRAAVAPVLVMSAVLVGACTTTSPKQTTTKAAFIAQADDICRTYDNRASKATRNLKHPDTERRIGILQDRLLPLWRQRDAALAQLKPPGADKAEVAQFLADLKAATDAVALDPGAYVAAHDTTPLAQKAATEAAAYGFAVCAQP